MAAQVVATETNIPNSASPATELHVARPRGLRLPLVSGRIAGKIIAPYLILIFILALLAIYVVTQLVSNSLEERFTNSLLDSGKAANESMVKLENENLQALRLMTNVQGATEALQAKDVTKLQELLLPLQANSHMDLVDVLAADGTELVGLRSDNVDATKVVDPNLGKTPLAQKVLAGQSDAISDKFTEMVTTSWGGALYTAASMKSENGTVVGAVLVGTTLERVLQRLSQDSQSSLTIYGSDGKIVSTSLPLLDIVNAGQSTGMSLADAAKALEFNIPPAQAKDVMGANPVLHRRALSFRGRAYQELVGAIAIRTVPAAPLGVAKPVTFIQQAAFASSRTLIIMFGVVVLGVLLLGIWLARVITTPLAVLVRATERVATGDLDQQVVVTTHDETGKLTRSFNHMVAGLREREQIRNMFSQYVTNQVAEAVLRGEVKLGGDRQEVTILITDIRSFTTLSESMAEHPEALVAMLNRYFNEMIDAIIEFGGILDKFIGDGILVEYNVPLPQDRHALRGILTALRMREKLAMFNADQVARGERTIRMGMGMHTGMAIVGNIGSEGKKVEYTAMGDTVNVASRLEGQTKELGTDIVISADSYELVKDFVDVSETVSLHVKGRQEAVEAYSLIGLKAGLTVGEDLIFTHIEQVRALTAAATAAEAPSALVATANGAEAATGVHVNGHANGAETTSVTAGMNGTA